MKKNRRETPATGPSMEGPADALVEVLSFARQALENLYNIRSHSTANNDLIEIDLLRWENELLKKRLSDLEKMIKEKL